MKTPKKYMDMLENRTITSSMLEEALYSVNKRAKNYRDKAKDYRHSRGRYSFQNAETATDKKEEMYRFKEKLLSCLEPICIHKEFAGYERTRVYDYQQDYDKEYFRHMLRDEIVWQNRYYDYSLGCEVGFFDYINPKKVEYRYYIYYILGTHSFHKPIDEKEAKRLPLEIEEIDTLTTEGDDIRELISMQFVKRLIELIDSKNYKYVCDMPDEPQKFENHIEKKLHKTYKINWQGKWDFIWNYIRNILIREISKQDAVVRELTNEEKQNIKIRQKSKKLKNSNEVIWKRPIVKCPELKLKKPELTKDLEAYINDNYTQDMGPKEFAMMILSGPINFQDQINTYASQRAYAIHLQKEAKDLYEKTGGHVVKVEDHAIVERNL